jgi:hypothetical protein
MRISVKVNDQGYLVSLDETKAVCVWVIVHHQRSRWGETRTAASRVARRCAGRGCAA